MRFKSEALERDNTRTYINVYTNIFQGRILVQNEEAETESRSDIKKDRHLQDLVGVKGKSGRACVRGDALLHVGVKKGVLHHQPPPYEHAQRIIFRQRDKDRSNDK